MGRYRARVETLQAYCESFCTVHSSQDRPENLSHATSYAIFLRAVTARGAVDRFNAFAH